MKQTLQIEDERDHYLFIELADEKTPSCLRAWVKNAAGEILHTFSETALSDLSAFSKTCKTIVAIPSDAASCLMAQLPALSARQTRAAIPYLIEDEVADDLENLHIVLGKHRTRDHLPVLVIKKDVLETYYTLLEKNGIEPDGLFPALFRLPVFNDAWVFSCNSSFIEIRIHETYGCVVDTENFEMVFQQLIQDERFEKPRRILIHSHEKLPHAIKVYLENHGFSIEAVNTQAPSLPPMELNLLTNKYPSRTLRLRTERITRLTWRSILLTAALGTLIACLHLASLETQWLWLTWREHRVSTSMPTLYSINQENTTQALENMRSIKHQGYFLYLLQKTGEALHRYPQVNIVSLDFNEPDITWTLQGEEKILNAIQSAWQQQGFNLHVQHTPTGSDPTLRVSISP